LLQSRVICPRGGRRESIRWWRCGPVRFSLQLGIIRVDKRDLFILYSTIWLSIRFELWMLCSMRFPILLGDLFSIGCEVAL
jgi:hypothetical protein